MSIFTILFVILLVAWILGFGVFHVAGGLIHLLLILALISLVLHFVRGPLGGLGRMMGAATVKNGR